MAGMDLRSQKVPLPFLQYSYVKESVFPFIKFNNVDPLLGPEMRSTGEVMGIGSNFSEAFSKASAAAGCNIPTAGVAALSLNKKNRHHAAPLARALLKQGFFSACNPRHTQNTK